MGVFGDFEDVVAALDFLLFPGFVGSHLLREVAVFPILQLHLALILE